MLKTSQGYYALRITEVTSKFTHDPSNARLFITQNECVAYAAEENEFNYEIVHMLVPRSFLDYLLSAFGG